MVIDGIKFCEKTLKETNPPTPSVVQIGGTVV